MSERTPKTLLRSVFFILVIAVLGVVLSWSIPSMASTPQHYRVIPPNASQILPLVVQEVDLYFPDIPHVEYLPALFEHESCITIKHRRCLRTDAELRSLREQGVGISQITRTFNPDGTVRFDSLGDMKRLHKDALRSVSWENIKSRPREQVRIGILMTRDNYKALHMVSDTTQRLKMTDAAYNGGRGGLMKERRACGLKEGCNPHYWDGNVEKVCLKSKKPLYGGRNACDINRHHVKDVFLRMPKYRAELSKYQ